MNSPCTHWVIDPSPPVAREDEETPETIEGDKGDKGKAQGCQGKKSRAWGRHRDNSETSEKGARRQENKAKARDYESDWESTRGG